jgi:hypothetical protein
MQGLASLTNALLPRAQGPEILYRLGHCVTEESHNNASTLASFNINVEKDLLSDFFKAIPVKAGVSTKKPRKIRDASHQHIPQHSKADMLQIFLRSLTLQTVPGRQRQGMRAGSRWM